jgi:hypothetical protein
VHTREKFRPFISRVVDDGFLESAEASTHYRSWVIRDSRYG